MRIRVPEPCRLQDEVHAAGNGLPVWLVSNVVSFAWVRGCPLSPIRHSQASSRTVVNPGERGSTLLESVLGATLASSNLASSATLTCGNADRGGRHGGAAERCWSHFLSQFWLDFELQGGGVPGSAAAVVPGHRPSERA